MRDFHKVQEQEGMAFSVPQIYLLIGLTCLSMGLIFVLGYSLGREPSILATTPESPLVPVDVQQESVAMLLARAAAAEDAQIQEQDQLALQFSDLLPSKTEVSAELPALKSPDAPLGIPGGPVSSAAVPSGVGSAAVSGTAELPSAPGGATGTSSVGGAGTGTVTKEPHPSTAVAGNAAKLETEGAKAAPARAAATASEAGAAQSSASVDSSKALRTASEKSKEPAPSGVSPGGEPRPRSAAASTPVAASAEKKAPARASGSSGEGGVSGRGAYTVQVSSYQETSAADRLVRQLIAQGFSAYRVEAEVNGHLWFRVRVGTFENRDGAEAELQRLKAARSELNPMIAHR